MFWGFDIYYFVLIIPAMLFALWAQVKVSSTFNRYSAQRTHTGMTGAQAAEAVLRACGVDGVRIERVAGNLTDHFDPRAGVIRLSQSVYDSPTVAAVGVAAHEAGHAAQYAEGYGPIRLRNAIIPVTQIGSSLAWPLQLRGSFLCRYFVLHVGRCLSAGHTACRVQRLGTRYQRARRGRIFESG